MSVGPDSFTEVTNLKNNDGSITDSAGNGGTAGTFGSVPNTMMSSVSR